MTLVGARRGFRPRGLGGSLAGMASAQAAVHMSMTWAPWAFGLAPHHHDAALISAPAVMAHAAAALVLALLAVRLEAWLARAIAAVAAVRRWLAPHPAPARQDSPLAAGPARASRPVLGGGVACRGPPRLLTA